MGGNQSADMNIPFFLGIMPLVSQRNAKFLHNEVPVINLTESVLARMEGKGGDSGAAAGLEIACELIDASDINCFYRIPPFGKVAIVLELIEYIRKVREGGR